MYTCHLSPYFVVICRYYVGVLDKTTGKMKICDAEIFQMHPKPSGKIN